MMPAALTVVVIIGLLSAALLGPRTLRLAAPALVHAPRLASGVLLSVIVVWLAAVLALGPLLAWSVTGPALLPGQAGDFCQQCLNSANPFSAGSIDTVIPGVVLLALPVVTLGVLAAGVTGELRRRLRSSRAEAARLLHGARPTRVHGYDVVVVPDSRPFAMTFPRRHGGIAVSQGALNALDDQELTAVLEHEAAHLRQHHHLATALIASIARYLRWVPLINAVDSALPHYLEIAADNAARHRAGTTAVVSALIKLGDRTSPDYGGRDAVSALHAAGPERIRHLVSPDHGRRGRLPALVVTADLAVLGSLSAVVYLSYLVAVLTGCL